MAKPNTRSVRAKQNAVLRYVASNGVKTTAKDFGYSESTIRRFIQDDPSKIAKNPKGYQRLVVAKPGQVAKEHNRKLITNLTGQELNAAFRKPATTRHRVTRIQITKATRQVHRVGGTYEPVPYYEESRGELSEIIAHDLSGYNKAVLDDMVAKGEIDQDEADNILEEIKAKYAKKK